MRFFGFSLLCLFNTSLAFATPPPSRPKLVVVIVVDQMRADYLRRFQPYFQEGGGLHRLLENGAFFENAAVPYFPTETAPGHTTISTGTLPRYHGMVSNKIYLDGEKQKSVETVDDDHEHLVGVDSDHAKGRSPARMVGSTIGDQLKLADKRSRVFSIALKDRAAILLAGKNPDAVFWCDKATGRVVTSSYYSDSIPDWAGKWNKAGGLFQYAGKTWLPSLDPACYDAATNCEPAWSRTLAA
ncbi:MAG TPA: alkaline phosphatase family protein, partial [Phycisphaerae bacterium]|nr:alkaline phosphatase family protein [Phycisphaerae bacterium]